MYPSSARGKSTLEIRTICIFECVSQKLRKIYEKSSSPSRPGVRQNPIYYRVRKVDQIWVQTKFGKKRNFRRVKVKNQLILAHLELSSILVIKSDQSSSPAKSGRRPLNLGTSFDKNSIFHVFQKVDYYDMIFQKFSSRYHKAYSHIIRVI